MKIAIQNNELGSRGGIATYSSRVNKYLNECEGVSSKEFVQRIRNSPDVINIQYEPGMLQPNQLNYFLQKYAQPIVITAHHIGILPQIYEQYDGTILHDKSQIPKGVEDPWDCAIIPHPALVFPKKDKKKLRKKYRLPEDKVIIGTAGFIIGTGKEIPNMTMHMINNMRNDEFFYCITSFWKGGDWGKADKTMRKVKSAEKESQFRMDTDFVPEEILNEKMQCCDLLFSWNNMYHGQGIGSQSGIAADMYGSYTKLIVKDGPHYSFIGKQDKVLVGKPQPEDFVKDVLKAVRNEDLKDIPDPKWLSWQEKIHEYKEYFEQFVEEK